MCSICTQIALGIIWDSSQIISLQRVSHHPQQLPTLPKRSDSQSKRFCFRTSQASGDSPFSHNFKKTLMKTLGYLGT